MNILRKIKGAVAQRRETRIPDISGLVGIYVVGLVVFLFLCYTGSPEHAREYQFASEKGSVTALSAIFLAMTSAFSAVTYHFSKKSSLHNSFFGCWQLLAFFFFR